MYKKVFASKERDKFFHPGGMGHVYFCSQDLYVILTFFSCDTVPDLWFSFAVQKLILHISPSFHL